MAAQVLIDVDGNFNKSVAQNLQLPDENCRVGAVSVVGVQGTGKSTLLNSCFSTKFPELDQRNGMARTTKGISIAVGQSPQNAGHEVLVLDIEGTDGLDRGRKNDNAFENKTTLFALAMSNTVIFNMKCDSVNLHQGSSSPLMETVFQVMLRKFSTRRHINLLFVLRDRNTAHSHDFPPGPWEDAHATFYGGADGSGTTDGACGYKDEGYGLNTAAVSPNLFNNGVGCGACFEVKCVNHEFCKPNAPPVTVTATNLGPPDQDGEHFDLTQLAFLQIAEFKAGIIPIQYRRVPCKREGGIKFTISGNPNFSLVRIMNEAGAGDVVKVEVRSHDKTHWIEMKRNWGEIWQTDTHLSGHKMKFRVTTSDGKVTYWKVTDKTWQYGQTYLGKFST